MEAKFVLLRCFRVHRSFLFAFTVEGLEVWTFPSDKLPAAENRDRPRLDDWGIERGGTVQYPAPWPRPCLLHVQKLEVGVARFWSHLTDPLLGIFTLRTVRAPD